MTEWDTNVKILKIFPFQCSRIRAGRREQEKWHLNDTSQYNHGSILQTSNSIISLLFPPLLWSKVLHTAALTQAKHAAARETLSPFQEPERGGSLWRTSHGDKDCYQVTVLNIETSLFDQLTGMFFETRLLSFVCLSKTSFTNRFLRLDSEADLTWFCVDLTYIFKNLR